MENWIRSVFKTADKELQEIMEQEFHFLNLSDEKQN